MPELHHIQQNILYSHNILVHISQILPICTNYTNNQKDPPYLSATMKCVFWHAETCCDCNFVHLCFQHMSFSPTCVSCTSVTLYSISVRISCSVQKNNQNKNMFNWCLASHLWVNMFAQIIFVHWNTFLPRIWLEFHRKKIISLFLISGINWPNVVLIASLIPKSCLFNKIMTSGALSVCVDNLSSAKGEWIIISGLTGNLSKDVQLYVHIGSWIGQLGILVLN